MTLNSPAYVVIKGNNKVYTPYVYYLFKSTLYLYWLKAYSYGITGDRLRLYFKDFSTIPIILPSVLEQKKIAEILSTCDRAIKKLQKLIKAKQKLKKGLMQQLLTGRLRFPEFEPRNTRKKVCTPLKDWNECQLGDCFEERIEAAPDLPLLSITAGSGVIPRDDTERKDISNVDKSRYKKIKPDDIGYNTMRMWQGVSAVSKFEGIVSPAYTICVPKKGYLSKYFGYLFKFPPMIHLFYRYSQGLVSDTLNLKFHYFAQIKVYVPTESEQQRIAEILQNCDSEIELLMQKENRLKNQKKGLMQKLLTGEVRVKV